MNYKDIQFIALCMACLSVSAAGQRLELPKEPLQQRTTGASGQDELVSLTTNWRGDVATVGNAAKGKEGGQDILLAIFDTHLSPLVVRHIGRQEDDGAHQIAVLPDGRYIVAGYSTRPMNRSKTRGQYFGKRDGWLLLLNERGETEREILLGTASDDAFVGVSVAPDGSFWATGNSGDRAWLVSFEANGDKRWEKFVNYKGQPTQAVSATLSPTGLLYMVGSTLRNGHNHCWLAGFNRAGEAILQKEYPYAEAEKGTGIICVDGQNMFISGTFNDPLKRENGFVAQITPDGTMLRYDAVGGRDYDQVNTLMHTASGELLLGGGSASFARGSRRISAWLTVSDTLLTSSKSYYYGSKLDDEVMAMLEHPDGRLLAIGTTARQVLKMRQGWLFQLTKMARVPKPEAGQFSMQIQPLSYPNQAAILQPGQRAVLPISIANNAKAPQYRLRAKISSPEVEVQQALLSGQQSVALAPIAAGQTLSWGIPVWLSAQAPAGKHTLHVQFFQDDNTIGVPIAFEVVVAEPKIEVPEVILAQQLTSTNTANTQPTSTLTIEVPPSATKSVTETSNYTVAVWVYPNPDNFDKNTLVWPQEEITVQVKVVSNAPITRQQFCIEINGEPCATGAKFDEVQMKGDKNSKTFSQTIRLSEGKNSVRATIQTPNGPIITDPLQVVFTPAKPNLHILSIGVPASDLKYTTKDARDFARTLASGSNQAFGSIFVDTLLTEERTTKTEILKSLRRLQYRYNDLQIMSKDLLVIFVSGHGIGAYDGSFRLAASDYDGPFMQETSLDFEQEVINYLQSLPCAKLFFVDACHSGNTSGSGLAGIATRKSGLNMLVSCKADEFSYEDDAWMNGAFTRALVRGLEGFEQSPKQFDTNHDGALDVQELFGFIQTEVPQLVEKKRPKVKTGQQPTLILADPTKPSIIFRKK